MKKNIFALVAAAACIILMAGCDSEEGPDELSMLIEQLQTTHLNTGSPEDSTPNEEASQYKSITGTVVSFTETGITVKSDSGENKFVINEETQIMGVQLSSAKEVTVTYCEPEKKSKGTIANVITIIYSANESIENTSEAFASDTTVTETSDSISVEPVTEPPLDASSDEQTVIQTETQSEYTSETESTVQTEIT